MTNTTATNPPVVEMLSTEDLTYTFDFTLPLRDVSPTELLTGSPTALATDTTTNTSASGILQGSPTVRADGRAVLQGLAGLSAGHHYRVIITAPTTSGNLLACRTDFVCTF